MTALRDTPTVDPYLPMPGDVHPSLHPDTWQHWSGMVEGGTVMMPRPIKPVLTAYDTSPTAEMPSPVIFTLRKVWGSLDKRFGAYWWWVWQGDDGRYVAAPMANWAPREPYASLWGTGFPLPP